MADPALVSAAAWISEAMTGTIATLIATVAIAAFGFVALQGRLSVRDGNRVVLGCFILFGAPFIAKALVPEQQNSTHSHFEDGPPVQRLQAVPAPSKADSDPYAGASVKLR